MKKTLGLIAALLLGALSPTWADYVVNGVTVSSSTTITPGVWTSQSQLAIKYAQDNHIPLLLLRANAGCSQCKKLEVACALDQFKEWAADRKLVMLLSMNTDPTADYLAARELTPETLIASGNMPKIAVYWWKEDGTTTRAGFVGRTGRMLGQSGSLPLVDQFINAIESVVGDYSAVPPVPPYTGGYFAVTNLPNSRLEVVVDATEAKSVRIPLYRTATGSATNTLVVGSEEQAITWSGSETSKEVTVRVNATTAGQTIALTLKDEDGETVSTSQINVVNEPANSVTNPYWVGEKTADTLGYGEWTLDYDVALEKVKAEGGVILADFSGVLWCPYCKGIEESLLADAAFKQWAVDNKVVFVLFDQPRLGQAGPRLLAFDEGRGHDGTASGAAYITRKGVTAADAKKVIDRTTELSTKTWLAPDTTATRLSNPTLLLINADGELKARFRAYRTSDRKYPTAENINRLNDLLLLQQANEKDNFRSTTTLTYEIGDDADGEIQINDNVDYFKLTSSPKGDIKISATDSDGKALTATLLTTNSTSYIVVSGYENALEVYGANTTKSYALTSSVVLIPAESAASYKTSKDTVTMRLVNGTTYNITGVAADALSANFTASGDYWVAKASGDIDLAVSSDTVTYQVWTPGTVAFTTTSQRLMESTGSGTITVARTGGASGKTVVDVAISKNLTAGRLVTPAGTTTLTWEDGESGEKTIAYTLNVDNTFQPTDTFTLSLTAGSECAATISSSAAAHTVTVIDSDKPMLDNTEFSQRVFANFAINQSYPVNNILENGRVTLRRVSGRLPSGITAKYDATTKSVILSGRARLAGAYTYTFTLSERRASGAATGLETTFTINVVNPSQLSTSDADYNPVVGTAVSSDVPLYATVSGSKLLAGNITLSINTSGRISARFTGAGASTTTYTGYWQDLDNGTATTVLTSSRGGQLALELTPEGKLSATVTGVTTSFGSSLATADEGVDLATKVDYAKYAGYYTVTLPVDTTGLTAGQETKPTGTGTLILKMDSAIFQRNGRVTYRLYLPDGSAASGSTVISPIDSQSARVTIFKSSSRYVIGVTATVRANAAETHTSDPMIVLADAATQPYWQSSTSGRENLLVYGGYYDKAFSLDDCCSDYYETSRFNLTADVSYLAPSGLHGAVTGVSTATIDVADDRITVTPSNDLRASIRLAKNTGLVSGSVKLQFANGRTVTARCVGVLLPYWADCGCFEGLEAIIDRPLFSGTAYFNDTVDGVRVKRSFEVRFDAVK